MMKHWEMWAVYAVEGGTLVSMHETEDQCINAAIEASTDNNLILTSMPVLIVERALEGKPLVSSVNDHDDPPLTPPRLGEGAL